MSSLPKNSDPTPSLPAWVLTGLGMGLIPLGLLIADRVQESWWPVGLRVAAAGSTMLLWGSLWLALTKTGVSLHTARSVAATLSAIVSVTALVIGRGSHPKQTIDLVAILLEAHLGASGLVLVALGADVMETSSRKQRRQILFWSGAFVLVTAGLFGLGWVLHPLAAWRFPALVAAGGLAFLATHRFRRRDAGR